jgi:hypothetical protein
MFILGDCGEFIAFAALTYVSTPGINGRRWKICAASTALSAASTLWRLSRLALTRRR